jgi:hypothetical protein
MGRHISSSRICQLMKDFTLVLVEFRALAGEVAFTLAALYGISHAVAFLVGR